MLHRGQGTPTIVSCLRVAAGLRMAGVFEVPSTLSIGRAIDDLLLIIECSLEGEWEGQVRYLPL